MTRGRPTSIVVAMVLAATVVATGAKNVSATETDDATRTAEPDVRLTVAGDSLALGIGASDSSRGFAFDLFERVRARRASSEVTNLAIGGATTADVSRLEVPRIARTHPTIVIVEVGANDVVRRHPIAEFASAYRRLIDGVHRSAPRAQIVLFNVPDVSVSPIFDSAAKPALHALAVAYNVAVAAEGKLRHDPVVDLFAFSKRATRDPARYLGADQFHPSDDGHAAIAEAAWPTLRSALDRAITTAGANGHR